MTDQLQDFIAAFHLKLGCSRRWEAFATIANILFSHKRPIVVLETGTARTVGNWVGDGQSTLVWDYLCKATNGFGYSIDLDPGACAVARKQVQVMSIVNDDSIRFLAVIQDLARRADLLYLDSFDWTHTQGPMSCLHHAGELAAVWGALPSGCLIAVDDCFSDVEGKHLLVKAFFDLLKIPPLISSYVHVWRKP